MGPRLKFHKIHNGPLKNKNGRLKTKLSILVNYTSFYYFWVKEINCGLCGIDFMISGQGRCLVKVNFCEKRQFSVWKPL